MIRIIQKYIIWFGPIFFLLITIKEIHIAQQYAELANLDLQQALSLWASEISAESNFTGAQLGTMLRIDRALYSFMIFGLWLFFSCIQNARGKSSST